MFPLKIELMNIVWLRKGKFEVKHIFANFSILEINIISMIVGRVLWLMLKQPPSHLGLINERILWIMSSEQSFVLTLLFSFPLANFAQRTTDK